MKAYKIECWHNGELINQTEHRTLSKLFHAASWLLVKHGYDDKGYSINALETQFRRRGCKRVGFENNWRNFSITLIRQ